MKNMIKVFENENSFNEWASKKGNDIYAVYRNEDEESYFCDIREEEYIELTDANVLKTLEDGTPILNFYDFLDADEIVLEKSIQIIIKGEEPQFPKHNVGLKNLILYAMNYHSDDFIEYMKLNGYDDKSLYGWSPCLYAFQGYSGLWFFVNRGFSGSWYCDVHKIGVDYFTDKD